MLHFCGIDFRLFSLWGLADTRKRELVEIYATFVSGSWQSKTHKTMTKENTVAVIYNCNNPSQKIIYNRTKLQRRLQQAIEDMAEDGFTNFLFHLDEKSQFPTSFINAIVAEKQRNPDISLTLMLEREVPLNAYTEYADEIIYAQANSLLSKSSALIIYSENYFLQLSRIIRRAQENCLPIVFVNV